MRRALAFATALALVAPIGLVGCGEEASVEREVKIEGPEGTRTIEQETSVKETGDPPGGNMLDETQP